MLNGCSLTPPWPLMMNFGELVMIFSNKMDDVVEGEGNESDGWWWLAKRDMT